MNNSKALCISDVGFVICSISLSLLKLPICFYTLFTFPTLPFYVLIIVIRKPLPAPSIIKVLLELVPVDRILSWQWVSCVCTYV